MGKLGDRLLCRDDGVAHAALFPFSQASARAGGGHGRKDFNRMCQLCSCNFFRNLLVAAGAGADFFRISLTGRRDRLILGYGMA